MNNEPTSGIAGRGLALAGAVLAALVGVWVGYSHLPQRGRTALVSSPAARVRSAPPAGTIVRGVCDALTVEAPMARQARPADEGPGDIVVLPDHGGADNNRGRAVFALDVPRAGVYAAWLRARWDNACGNSVLLAVDDNNPYLAGEDYVFNTWHWVRAGRWNLTAGAHRLTLSGHEDGVALDEVLLTPDAAFVPSASARGAAAAPDLRRTGDNFDRSPGHGLDPWQVVAGRWDIAFTLDPNRIPNQYALTGRPDTNGAPAVAVLQADPWQGARVSYSFSPTEPGAAGALFGHGAGGTQAWCEVLFEVTSNAATLQVSQPGGATRCDLGDRVRLGQWHRVVIERWAWVLRVAVDGACVFTSVRSAPDAGAVGFGVRAGAAVFDDVFVEEIPWQAEDGDTHMLPWMVGSGARWDRVAPACGGGLEGRRGELRTGLDGLPVHAVLLDDAGSVTCRVAGATMTEVCRDGTTRLLAASVPSVAGLGDAVALTPVAGRAAVRRAAVAYGAPSPDVYVEGPYHFSAPMMEDPADYLDFTADELRQTEDAGQAGKLRREMKRFHVVGRRTDGSPWIQESGRWEVRDEALVALTSGEVQHWRDLGVSLDMRGRVCLNSVAAAAGVDLYGGIDAGVHVRLLPGAVLPGAVGPTNTVLLPVPADGTWHAVRVRVDGTRLRGAVDGRETAVADVRRGLGGTVRLVAGGSGVRFDDVEFRVPRVGAGEFFYGFDRRETDWWHEGGLWIDHGGIACALASHWISLVAPQGRGVLWNKRIFGRNLLVAFTLEENSEWFGWDHNPSHAHHPYDNIAVILAPSAAWDAGYRLEVNARGRTATVLYRNGVQVAAVAQDDRFPMVYVGGHQPYEPRRNRITLAAVGGQLRAFVNNVEVLTFRDPEPLPVARVGVGGFDTHANFSHIEIREL